MKILIAAGIFPPDIGGPAIYSKEIAKEFNERGVSADVVCYANDSKSVFAQKEGLGRVFKISRKYPTLLRYCFYFWQILKIGWHYDIIYAQGPVSSGFPASLAAKLLKKKFTVKVTGDYAWEQARNLGLYVGRIENFQKTKFQKKIGRLRKIERRVCQSADLVITPSEYLKKIVIGWGVDSRKIKVIYNAVRGDIDSQSGDRDDNLILSIGRLVSWKGFDVLIGLMPELLKANPDFKLTIFGSGPEEENLNNLIIKLKLKEKVFISHKPREYILNFLKQAGVFVLNTDYEGLSHVILEAMTAGAPIVATNVGGNPEVIRDGYNGFLVEYNNRGQLKEAILKFYHNPQMRQDFIDNSQNVLEKFSFEKMVNQTIKALQSL